MCRVTIRARCYEHGDEPSGSGATDFVRETFETT
jgi:hypothetical protein